MVVMIHRESLAFTVIFDDGLSILNGFLRGYHLFVARQQDVDGDCHGEERQYQQQDCAT